MHTTWDGQCALSMHASWLLLLLLLLSALTLTLTAVLQLDDIEALNYDDLSSVAKLSSTAGYKDIMQVRPRPTLAQPPLHNPAPA